MPWDEGLREQQTSVAGSPRGHLVLLAGPGTGKTYVLVRRVEHLIEVHGIPACAITAVTFTRAAAAEMRDRLENRLGAAGKQVRVSTLHSYALRELLREGASQLPDPLRVVGDWEERHVVVQELAWFLERPVRAISNGRDGALERLADDWDTLAVDGAGWEEGFPDPQFLGAWRRHREVYGYTLRSELVYQLLNELRSNPDFNPSAKAAVVLVDEYQDLNRCELDTVGHLVERSGAELLAAGDDDQSIYSFRHAHPAGIRGFTDAYLGSAQLTMTECLRCGQAVVDLANWLIAQEPDRVAKTLVSVTDWDAEVRLLRFQSQASEAAGVARIVEREIALGTPPEEILILMKLDTRARISTAVAKALREVDIDVYLPRRPRDLDESVQKLLEYLILAKGLSDEAPFTDDLAVRSLIELEDNQIGETRLRRLVTYAYESGQRFLAAVDAAREDAATFPPGQYSSLFAEIDRIIELARALGPTVGEDFDAWIVRLCEELDVSPEGVEIVTQATHQVAAEFEEGEEASSAPRSAEGDAPESTAELDDDVADDELEVRRRAFVQDLLMALTGLGDALPSRVEGSVTLTTMHGAKGLSADTVIVLQAEEEVIPGDAQGPDLDEARRLLYVSLTRAKKKLLISACTKRTGPQRFVGQKEVVDRHLTSFLTDYGFTAYSVEDYLSAYPLPEKLGTSP